LNTAWSIILGRIALALALIGAVVLAARECEMQTFAKTGAAAKARAETAYGLCAADTNAERRRREGTRRDLARDGADRLGEGSDRTDGSSSRLG
jgi:hypothetical protein